MPKTKVCSICDKRKRIEKFNQHRSMCKTCQRVIYPDDKTARRAYNARYQLEHHDELLAKRRLRYKEHAEEIKAYWRAWTRKNHAHHRAMVNARRKRLRDEYRNYLLSKENDDE